MDPELDDAAFLRDLVKSSRQRPHWVEWVDRDGTQRRTALSDAQLARLQGIAGRDRHSLSEALRRAAHIPNAKRPGG